MLSIRNPNCPFNGHSIIYMMYMPDFLSNKNFYILHTLVRIHLTYLVKIEFCRALIYYEKKTSHVCVVMIAGSYFEQAIGIRFY
jgi:hypothetical protein